MNAETYDRVVSMALRHRITVEEAIERAVTTQWFLDTNLNDKVKVVLHGPGRKRQEVKFP